MLPSDNPGRDRKIRKKFSLDSAVRNSEKPDKKQQSEDKKHARETHVEEKNPKQNPVTRKVRSVSFDSAGLVLPRKLVNPCMQSVVVREINREIKWTSKK